MKNWGAFECRRMIVRDSSKEITFRDSLFVYYSGQLPPPAKHTTSAGLQFVEHELDVVELTSRSKTGYRMVKGFSEMYGRD